LNGHWALVISHWLNASGENFTTETQRHGKRMMNDEYFFTTKSQRAQRYTKKYFPVSLLKGKSNDF